MTQVTALGWQVRNGLFIGGMAGALRHAELKRLVHILKSNLYVLTFA
jgi:hypothetical protein